MVEHLKVLFNLLICPSNKSKNGRAPKGDGGLISRACLRILTSRACLRTLKVQFTYWVGGLMVEPAYASFGNSAFLVGNRLTLLLGSL